MACMCGDTHCWSCGPAQGNFKCPICHRWADDGCEHFAEDGTPANQEVQTQLSQLEAREREADEQLAKRLFDTEIYYEMGQAQWMEG